MLITGCDRRCHVPHTHFTWVSYGVAARDAMHVPQSVREMMYETFLPHMLDAIRTTTPHSKPEARAQMRFTTTLGIPCILNQLALAYIRHVTCMRGINLTSIYLPPFLFLMDRRPTLPSHTVPGPYFLPCPCFSLSLVLQIKHQQRIQCCRCWLV